MLNKIQVLTPNLEALQREFAPRNHKIHQFLFFASLRNYSLISKLLGEFHMHLILQLITCVADCQKLLRDLLVVFQMLDHCQLSVLYFSYCWRTVLCYTTLQKTSLILQKELIHKHGSLLAKKLFKYFSVSLHVKYSQDDSSLWTKTEKVANVGSKNICILLQNLQRKVINLGNFTRPELSYFLK